MLWHITIKHRSRGTHCTQHPLGWGHRSAGASDSGTGRCVISSLPPPPHRGRLVSLSGRRLSTIGRPPPPPLSNCETDRAGTPTEAERDSFTTAGTFSVNRATTTAGLQRLLRRGSPSGVHCPRIGKFGWKIAPFGHYFSTLPL